MKHNILIVCRSLPIHTLGGMELITLDLVSELAKNSNNDVTVLTTDIEPEKNNRMKTSLLAMSLAVPQVNIVVIGGVEVL